MVAREPVLGSPVAVEELGVEESRVEVNLCRGRLTLRRFQARVLEEYRLARRGRGPRLLLLEAPTGAGKTLTLLLPFLDSGQGALGVYPSRELARDQMESLASLLERLGCAPFLEKPYVRGYEVGGRSLYLVRITSDSLEEIMRDKEYGSKTEALEAVRAAIERGRFRDGAAIVFTVPEYPYLLLEAGYRDFEEAGGLLYMVAERLRLHGPRSLRGGAGVSRGEALRFLSTYALIAGSLVFLDEFHSYGAAGYAVAALAWAALAEATPYGMAVLSSATPDAEAAGYAAEMARRLGAEVVHVRASPCPSGSPGCAAVRRRTLLVPVLYTPRASGAVAYVLVQREMPDTVPMLLRDAEERMKKTCGTTWRKAMVFFDRVSLVYQAAERLHEAGYSGIACVTSMRRGYRHPACDAGDPRSARIVVGNEAISYGIDIPEVDAAVVYARDWAQALQRIGRVGRGPHPEGCPALVYLALPAEASKKLGTGMLDYQGLAGLLKNLYPGIPSPAAGPARRLARVRAAVFLAAYTALRSKASIDMLGTSDKALERALDPPLEEAQSLLQEAAPRIALGNSGFTRLLGLRGGLSARACGPAGVYEAGLTVLLRNFVATYSPERGCIEPGEPVSYAYASLETMLPPQSRSVVEQLHGAVISLGLAVEALAAGRLTQETRGESRTVAPRVSDLFRDALDPGQPVLLLSATEMDPGFLEALAALGDAILVKDAGGEVVAALAAP